MAKTRNQKRQRRKLHIRKNLWGSADVPRINVYRSNRYVYVQAVNDDEGKTLMGMSTKVLKKKENEKPAETAMRLGEEFGKKLKAKKISRVVFDRAGYKFHGRVKALAEGIRKSGINL
jgi:large subunit ribosomal protein L18